MLEAINLTCVRGERHLFQRLNFHIKPGECLVVHGENGSGKTSLLRILVGLTPPADGRVYWNGRQVRQSDDQYRNEVLYCGHALGLKEELTAIENLTFGCALSNEPVDSTSVREALQQAGLQGREHLPLRALSQGQKRRVNLARLLLQRRALWVLDEPLTALDAKASQWAARVIDEHLSVGGIAVLTTHEDIPLNRPIQVIRVGA